MFHKDEKSRNFVELTRVKYNFRIDFTDAFVKISNEAQKMLILVNT